MSQITCSVRFFGKPVIRLECSLSNTFTSPIYGDYATGETKIGWVKLTCGGLAPNTEYYVRPNFVGSNPAIAPVGRFKTPPASAHSFSFAAASCWNPTRTTNSKFIFPSLIAKAVANEIAFFIHTGDMHYADLQTEAVEAHRAALEPVFTNNLSVTPDRRNLMKSLPVYYMYDDHDAGGPNNGDSKDVGTIGGIEFFRKATPNPDFYQPLITQSPFYSFVRGRVKFVVTDLRNDCDPVSDPPGVEKRGMYAAQDAWFRAEILAAAAADQPVFWICTKPWIAANSSLSDDWGGYYTHRQEIADFITANSLSNKVAIISGDMHALAFDDGTNSRGGMKVMHAAPIDQSNTTKGGPYTISPITATQQQYGLFDITDSGSGPVTVRFRGISCGTSSETVEIDQTFSLG